MPRVTKYIWFILIPALFIVYSTGFSEFRVIKERGKALGLEDSMNYMILIQDFSLSKKYGDEYNTINRSDYDCAQKHKIHHVLYVGAASLLYKLFLHVYELLGIPSNQALFSINAFLACVSISLLYVLLRHFHPGNDKIGWYLLLYAFSLNTWIYASIPGSWYFMSTLILSFLVFFYKEELSPYSLSVIIGIFMLANLFLGSLFIFLVIRYLTTASSTQTFLKKTMLSGVTTLSTWLLLLLALSLFDGSYRPDNLYHFTVWFKTFLGYRHTTTEWPVVFTNMFINAILSNQSDPGVPLNAILLTFKQSIIGTCSTLIYVGLCGLVLVRMLRSFRAAKSGDHPFLNLVKREEFHWVLYCLIWVSLTFIMYPPGAFLYATTIVPFIVLLISKFIDIRRAGDRIILYAAIIAVLLNNAVQVMKFRDALGNML
jgi:hypothetical protein